MAKKSLNNDSNRIQAQKVQKNTEEHAENLQPLYPKNANSAASIKHLLKPYNMKTLISFLIFIISSLYCYSHTSMTGAPRQSAAQRATFNDIISVGELIKSVKEGNVGIKKIAEKSGYAFRGRYHDPELNDFYYEDVYYKNCMVAADGSPIKYGKGNSSVLIAGSVGFGPFVSIRVFNKRAYNHIKSELRNKFHFKTAEVDGKWTTLKKGNVVVDVSVDGNAYCFTIYTK